MAADAVAFFVTEAFLAPAGAGLEVAVPALAGMMATAGKWSCRLQGVEQVVQTRNAAVAEEKMQFDGNA